MRRARPFLGTIVDITVVDAGPSAAAAIDAAFASVADIHRLMSFHDPASDVSRVNREGARRAIAVDERTYCVLEFAVALHNRSGSLFDVGIGRRLQALGLLPSTNDTEGAAPSANAAVATLELLADHRVLLHDPAVRIDLGGIAKGYAVDCAAAALRERGIHGAIVNAGGDCAAFGPVPQSVRIRDPRAPGRALCEVALLNEALASSAGRFDPFHSQATALSAIVDSRTGLPAVDVIGASIRASTCMVADALTKIVMLAGKQAGALLRHYDAQALLVSASGEVTTTAAWQTERDAA
ncbi:MAG: FAD:protein FMN transferase [Beijerinckiaceae bacterium]